jgi:hypothetical protein
MQRRSISRPFFLLTVCAPLVAAAAPQTPTPPPPAAAGLQAPDAAPPPKSSHAKEARAHYARGVALYEQRAYADALAAFQRAHTLVPSPKLLFSMGQAHAGMGQYARAIEELEAYVERVGSTVPVERRLQIERQLEAFRARVGQLEVHVNVAGATVRVDGATVGKSPLPVPLVLDAGSHRITAERTEHLSASARVSVVGTETTPVHLALQSTTHTESAALATPLWITTGVCGALALGSGIVTLLQRRSYDQSLEQAHSGDATAIQQDLQQQRARLEKWLLATDILIGATAVAGIGAIYVSVRNSDDDAGVTASRGLDVSASVSGRF